MTSRSSPKCLGWSLRSSATSSRNIVSLHLVISIRDVGAAAATMRGSGQWRQEEEKTARMSASEVHVDFFWVGSAPGSSANNNPRNQRGPPKLTFMQFSLPRQAHAETEGQQARAPGRPTPPRPCCLLCLAWINYKWRGGKFQQTHAPGQRKGYLQGGDFRGQRAETDN